MPLRFKSLRYQDMDLRTQRIEALTDGVFAIIMTLLVLELIGSELFGDGSQDLNEKLADVGPKFAWYLMSFSVLGIFWLLHNYQFSYVKTMDGIGAWINTLFLASAALVPFSTMLVGTYQNSLSANIYTLNLTFTDFFLLALWIYATRSKRLVEVDIPRQVTKLMMRTLLAAVVIFLVTMAIGTINWTVGQIALNISAWIFVFLTAVGAYRAKSSEETRGNSE